MCGTRSLWLEASEKVVGVTLKPRVLYCLATFGPAGVSKQNAILNGF